MENVEALSPDQIEELIEEILTASKIYIEKELDRTFLFRHPTVRMKRQARLLYERFYEEARQAGLFSVEEMEVILKERGIYTDLDEIIVEQIDGKIKAQKEVLKRTFRVPANRERLLNIIKNLSEEKNNILRKKLTQLNHTCEAKASERKIVFQLVNCVFDFEDDTRLWRSIEEFENWNVGKNSMLYKTNLMTEFMGFTTGLGISVVRQVARSGLWRVRYIMAKNAGVDLFGISVSEFSPDQINLMYWTEFYSSIYEMMPEDRPSDEIIENDDALDAYMDDYIREKNRDNAAARGSRHRGKKSAFAHDQVIVTRSNPMYQDIDYTKIPDNIKNKDSIIIDERAEARHKSARKVGKAPDKMPKR